MEGVQRHWARPPRDYNNGQGRCPWQPECDVSDILRAGYRVGATLLLMMALAPMHAAAQWSNNRGYQLLQRVDDVLFGMDNLSLVILDRRHVAGTLLRINVLQPAPIRGSTGFVVDCDKPLRFAAVPATMPGRPDPAKLEFVPVRMLDGTWAAAEFACEVTRQPARAARLARDLYERGGPPDMQTVYCELQPDGSEQVRPGVEVSFSESADAVAVNRQWLSSGSVTTEEVRFGTRSVWHLDRQGLHVRRMAPGGEMLFSGACDRRRPPPARQP